MTPQAPLDPHIDFSLLHPTARLPNGWCKAHDEWLAKCDRPERYEHILAIDADQWDQRPQYLLAVRNDGRPCAVDAWNEAARHARGRVLVVVSDDLFPCDHWDTKLLDVFLNKNVPMSLEYVIEVNNGPYCREVITQPILTRAYYLRLGRGGHPHGELFYPGYLSVGSDDDFTLVARRDKVVIDARHLSFPHPHYRTGEADVDEVYRWTNRNEAWDVKSEVLPRRIKENFAR